MQLIYEVRACALAHQRSRLAGGAKLGRGIVSAALLSPSPLLPLARLSLATLQARDLDIDAKPRSDQPTRFAFQKLTTAETKAPSDESAEACVTAL